MYTVFRPKKTHTPLLFNPQHSMLFDLEPTRFRYSKIASQCDFAVVLRTGGKKGYSQIKYLHSLGWQGPVLLLYLYHIEENQPQPQDDPVLKLFQKNFSTANIVHTNLAARDQGIYYDFLWERQRVYFTEYQQHPNLDSYTWVYNTTQDMWQLDEITLNSNPQLYLAPMRTPPDATEEHRDQLRRQLRELLKNHCGYYSDLEKSSIIESQEYSQPIAERFRNPQASFAGGTWYPAHNRYYRDSIASIYVETITYGSNLRSITEKTWDPLIKGHFIIPYGYQGMIQDLRDYGVKLPTWIDYSYDTVDDDQRFKQYLQSVKKFLVTDIQTLKNNYYQDQDLLLHNRQLWFDAEHHSVWESIKRWLRPPIEAFTPSPAK